MISIEIARIDPSVHDGRGLPSHGVLDRRKRRWYPWHVANRLRHQGIPMKAIRRSGPTVEIAHSSRSEKYAFAIAAVSVLVAGLGADKDQPAEKPKALALFDGKSLDGW